MLLRGVGDTVDERVHRRRMSPSVLVQVNGLARSLSVDELADRVDEVGYGGEGPNNLNYGRLLRWRFISGALREFG
jgi:hypothetical protein